MIGVVVTFEYREEFDRARVEAVAKEARTMFEGMPGLRAKYFTIDEDRRRATNFYVWDAEDAARGFFSDALRERVTGLYGVAPDVEFVDVLQAVENHPA